MDINRKGILFSVECFNRIFSIRVFDCRGMSQSQLPYIANVAPVWIFSSRFHHEAECQKFEYAFAWDQLQWRILITDDAEWGDPPHHMEAILEGEIIATSR
jgi:hypothetical protein